MTNYSDDYKRIVDFIKEKKKEEACELIDKILDNNPLDDMALTLKVYVCSSKKEAVHLLKQALAINPNNKKANILINKLDSQYKKNNEKPKVTSKVDKEKKYKEQEKPKDKFIDLKKKKWDKISAKVEFSPEFINDRRGLPIFHSTYSDYHLGKEVVLICVRCGEIFPLQNCSNCGYEGYNPGLTTNRTAGIFCVECETGFSHWTCSSCGANNPINVSIAVEKSGCFIATSIYGYYDHPNVLILRKYRDEFLLTNICGVIFVKLYYLVSPYLIKIFMHNKMIKYMVKKFVLDPLVKKIKHILN